MNSHAPGGLELNDVTSTTAMIAVQGPRAAESLQPLADTDLGQLKRFRCVGTTVAGARALVSRTGYTGEDGFEVVVFDTSAEHPEGASRVWEKLASTSTPCGLGARDSLRLEAGLPLHGSDIDQKTNPFEADLAWVISPGKTTYVGSDVVAEQAANPPRTIRRGLVLDMGIPRHGFDITDSSGRVGVVTSGTFSPLLRKGVAQCHVRHDSSAFGTRVDVDVRDSAVGGTITKPPFYDGRVYGWKRAKSN